MASNVSLDRPEEREPNAVLTEQAAYYRARAGEYDEWWQRAGRYDRGEDHTARWNDDVAELEAALQGAELTGDVLELACGTGWWTERLARRAATLTCLDASPEVLALNRERIEAAGLPLPLYDTADLFDWSPNRRYDEVFFSFWVSHVPFEKSASFWTAVGAALRPGGTVFFIDSAPEETSGARGHDMPDADGLQVRRLNDGRTFRIVKLFHDPSTLTSQLSELGWKADIRRTSRYFVYGSARRL